MAGCDQEDYVQTRLSCMRDSRAQSSGRIRVKHQRPDGLPCECESRQAHKRESSVEGCDLETHETALGPLAGAGQG